MPEPIHFHTDLYRREAVEAAAQKYSRKARIELAVAGAHVVARLEPLARDQDWQALQDEFCNEAFSDTARRMRSAGAGEARTPDVESDAPPWSLLEPFTEDTPLALGWVLESLGPVRGGAATMVLRHEDQGRARVAIRRNGGAPLGVAHTRELDFMLMNGGSGDTRTEESVGRVLRALAAALETRPPGGASAASAGLQPHAETPTAAGARPGAPTPGEGARRLAPHIDLDQRAIAFEIDEPGVSRLALYDALLRFADRCYVFLTRP
ncbi:MAG TPA: HxsD-like protein, partial [Candidatus Dormibacteraeota bacterium]|nr:HxsD-like protein [Candidatus Dormibacteraeota bacterium]